MVKVLKEEYRFPRIAASTTGQKYTRILEPQPCRITEVHTSGGSSTDYDVYIYDEEDYDKINLIYSKTGINLESHERLSKGAFTYNSEKRYIFFLINNNDGTNPLDLKVKIVYELVETE